MTSAHRIGHDCQLEYAEFDPGYRGTATSRYIPAPREGGHGGRNSSGICQTRGFTVFRAVQRLCCTLRHTAPHQPLPDHRVDRRRHEIRRHPQIHEARDRA